MKHSELLLQKRHQQPSGGRLAAAAVVGLAFPLVRRMVHAAFPSLDPTIEFPIVLIAYVVVLGIVSLPYRNYRAVLKIGLAAAIGFAIHASFFLFVAERAGWGSYFWVPVLGVPVYLCGTLLVNTMVLSGLLWVRNRYWPCFSPGYCARCGYCLFGLPTERCPECGTPFNRSTLFKDQGNVGFENGQRVERVTKEHVDANG